MTAFPAPLSNIMSTAFSASSIVFTDKPVNNSAWNKINQVALNAGVCNQNIWQITNDTLTQSWSQPLKKLIFFAKTLLIAE